MLRPFVQIKIQQVKNYTFKDKDGVINVIPRDELITLDFVHTYEIESSWADHTDSAKITLPKNVILQSKNSLFRQSGTYNVILGGTSNNTDAEGNEITYAPLLMRGDVVYIQDGYLFQNEHGKTIQVGGTVFKGYISKINSSVPIEIECEDNFYLLKHTPVNTTQWTGDLVDLCKKLLNDTNKLFGLNSDYEKNGVNPYPILSFTDNVDSITANFSLGYLDIGDGLTASLLLTRMRSQYGLESTFVDDVLQFGFPIYDELRANSKNFFEFQNNIFDKSSLEYTNKEDVVLSTIVKCKTIKKTGKTTHDGQDSTKRDLLEVLVYWDVPTEDFKYIVKKTGEPLPSNSGGERHTCYYASSPTQPAPSIQTLVDYGIAQLKKYYYTGFRGMFQTFGYPIVQWNDNVNILDDVISDRNGQYKVKKVKRIGGIKGITQQISLDYKQQVSIPTNTIQISML